MNEQTILFAKFPLPPSVNELYATSRNGGRHKTKKGVTYTEEVVSYLNIGMAPAPYFIQTFNIQAIQAIRSLYSNPSKAKDILTQRKRYAITFGFSFDSQRSDVDGRIKPFQDTIFDWIAGRSKQERGVPFDDRAVFELHAYKQIQTNTEPFALISLCECSFYTPAIFLQGDI